MQRYPASRSRLERSRPYLPILARTLYCLGRFEEAGDTYNTLAKQDLVFKNAITGEEDSDWEWELCFHRCICLKGAGKHDAAISALAEFAERRKVRLPDPVNKTFLTWGTGWWIARWYSEHDRVSAQTIQTIVMKYRSNVKGAQNCRVNRIPSTD